MDEAIRAWSTMAATSSGPEVARARSAQLAAFCGAEHVAQLRQRHRRAGAGADGEGRRPRRRGARARASPSRRPPRSSPGSARRRSSSMSSRTRFNLDPASLEAGIATARRLGLTPAGRDHRRPVRPAGRLRRDRADLRRATACGCSCDAAQSFGADVQAAARSARSATSRRPASSRPSRSAATATAARSSPTTTSSPRCCARLRVHGQGSDKYDNVRIGMNGRLDTMQAAVLIEKLQIFRRRDRGARARRRALQRAARATSPSCREVTDGADLGLGAVHDPASRVTTATRSPPRLKARGHPDRDLLPEAAAPPDRLSATIRSPATACRSPSASPPRCSACRCTPISTRRAGPHRRRGQGRVARRRARPPRVVAAAP